VIRSEGELALANLVSTATTTLYHPVASPYLRVAIAVAAVSPRSKYLPTYLSASSASCVPLGHTGIESNAVPPQATTQECHKKGRGFSMSAALLDQVS